MRTWSTATVLFFAFAGCQLAAADSFDYAVANIVLLQDKSVQKDLGVTEDQRKKLNTHADWYNAQLKDMDKSYQADKAKNKGKAKIPVAKLQGAQTELKKRVMAELTAKQQTRLREVTLQAAGIPALFDPAVATKLGLNSTQTKGLKDTWTSLNKKTVTLRDKAIKIENNAAAPVLKSFPNTKPKDAAEDKARKDKIDAALKKVEPQVKKLEDQVAVYRQQLEAYVEKTLTPQQLSTYKALQGAPLKSA